MEPGAPSTFLTIISLILHIQPGAPESKNRRGNVVSGEGEMPALAEGCPGRGMYRSPLCRWGAQCVMEGERGTHPGGPLRLHLHSMGGGGGLVPNQVGTEDPQRTIMTPGSPPPFIGARALINRVL